MTLTTLLAKLNLKQDQTTAIKKLAVVSEIEALLKRLDVIRPDHAIYSKTLHSISKFMTDLEVKNMIEEDNDPWYVYLRQYQLVASQRKTTVI